MSFNEKMYKGIYDENSYYYCSLNEIGISNSVSGEDMVLITPGENNMFTSFYISNRGIIYSVNTVNRDGVEKVWFYDVSTKENVDITEMWEELGGIRVYNGYLNKLVWTVKSEPDENGKISVIGYDVMNMADFLSEN